MINPNAKALCLFLMLLLFATAAPLRAQSGATVLVTTDLDCNWKLDGKPQGVLKADDAKVVQVSLGKHLVQATSADGHDKWKTVVNVSQAGQEMVEIKLKDAHQRRVAETERTEHPTWNDPATGLMWARESNSSDVTWNQASNYCSNLRLAGYSNWRLATIDELAGIYDQTQNVDGCHTKGGIRFHNYCVSWSSSAGRASGEAWTFVFSTGERDSDLLALSGDGRALCVRRSGE